MTDLRALHQRALDDGRPLLDRVGAADLKALEELWRRQLSDEPQY